jgi:hypothetical protein
LAIAVTIDPNKLGSTYLYDSDSGLHDFVGHLLQADGLTEDRLDGFTRLADVAKAVLTGQLPGTKDVQIGRLNRHLVGNDFTDRAELATLYALNDALLHPANASHRWTILRRMKAMAGELGYDVTYTEEEA